MGILLINVKIRMQIKVTSTEELAVSTKYMYSKRSKTPINTAILFATSHACNVPKSC